MNVSKIHDSLKPIEWLLGIWKTKNGIINYPTMKCPIKFNESLSFKTWEDPTILNYTSIRWNPKDEQPTDLEGGFLRLNNDKKSVSLLTSQNDGISTIEEGTMKHGSMFVASRWIGSSKFGKDKLVGLTRSYRLNKKGQLIFKMEMATPEVRSLTEYIFAVFDKVTNIHEKEY